MILDKPSSSLWKLKLGFKYTNTGMQFDNKKNHEKLIHDVAKTK